MAKQVELHTTAGVITLELDEVKAPVTVENFLSYVADGHYDGTVFHRVIKSFMIQGGGFEAGMKQKATKGEIKNEAPHSASAQFFINAADNDFLNFKSETPNGWGYAVFGKVIAGADVVSQIEKVRTGNKGGHGDVPLEDVVITKVVAL
jgi:peptidyl-prolyl cis-trans isomerase B (cyclophilin B)